MAKINHVLNSTGWSTKENSIENIEHTFRPDKVLVSSHWHAEILKHQEIILEKRNEHNAAKQNTHNLVSSQNNNINSVKVIDQFDLENNPNVKAKIEADQTLISNIITQFNLNIEQIWAFKIIANHATGKTTEQLKMYLGGMSGTGKS